MIDKIKKNKAFIIGYICIIILMIFMTQYNNRLLVINNNTNPYFGISENDRSMQLMVANASDLQFSFFVFNILISTAAMIYALVITSSRNNTLKTKWFIALGIIVLFAFSRWGVRRYVGEGVENIEEIYRAYIAASVATVLYIITILRYTISGAKEIKKESKEKKTTHKEEK